MLTKKMMMTGREFLEYVRTRVTEIGHAAGAAEAMMYAAATAGSRTQRRMASTMARILVDYGKRRISAKVSVEDMDRPIVELVSLYRDVAADGGLASDAAPAALQVLRRAARENRKYFEKRDGKKYPGKRWKEPVRELMERHLFAATTVIEESGQVARISEKLVLPKVKKSGQDADQTPGPRQPTHTSDSPDQSDMT